MREGALIDYRLRVRGVPLRWRTRVNVWQPPHRFGDEQLRGPYRQWIHEHTFDASLSHRWWVRPDIERIFQFRGEALRQRFAAPRA